MKRFEIILANVGNLRASQVAALKEKEPQVSTKDFYKYIKKEIDDEDACLGAELAGDPAYSFTLAT